MTESGRHPTHNQLIALGWPNGCLLCSVNGQSHDILVSRSQRLHLVRFTHGQAFGTHNAHIADAEETKDRLEVSPQVERRS